MVTREELETEFGQVWDTSEATRDFEFRLFLAPFALVTRRVDGRRGTLQFTDSPRFYYRFKESP